MQYYYKKLKTYFANEMVMVEVRNEGEQLQEAAECDSATFWYYFSSKNTSVFVMCWTLFTS